MAMIDRIKLELDDRGYTAGPEGSLADAWVPANAPIASQVTAFSTVSANLTPGPASEFVVTSDFSANAQHVAALLGGGYAILYVAQDLAAPVSFGVYVQVCDAAGLPLGPRSLVNGDTAGQDSLPAIAALVGGGFVVTWSSYGGPGDDAHDVFSQRYDAGGARVGSETRLSAAAAFDQLDSKVVALDDGGWLIHWHGADADGNLAVYAQRFAGDGQSQAAEVVLATSPTGSLSSDVVRLANGGYAATWLELGDPANGQYPIYAARLDNSLQPVGDPALVGTFDFADADGPRYEELLNTPSIAALAGGGYVIAWVSLDSDGPGIYARRYDDGGVAQGSAILINATQAASQVSPTIAGLAGGGYVIAWASPHVDVFHTGTDILAQRYDGQGNAVGGETLVTTSWDLVQAQVAPSIAALPHGGYIVTWHGQSFALSPADPNFGGIAAAVFPNHLPTGTPSLAPSLEDLTFSFAAAALLQGMSDADGDTLTVVGPVTVTQHGSIAYNRDGSYTLRPEANYVGPITVSYSVSDGFGTVPVSASFDLAPVNDAPAGADKTVLTGIGTPYVFTVADFGFADPVEGNALLGVKIGTLPGPGMLTDDGVAVWAGQIVSARDIAAGMLAFTPAASGSGAPYASFTFQVQDDGGTINGGIDLDPTPDALTIDVRAGIQPPAGQDRLVATDEDTPLVLGLADFPFTDADHNALSAVRITSLSGGGMLLLGNAVVSAGDFVSASDISFGKLEFRPQADGNGTPYASIAFQVQDDGGGNDLDPSANTLTIDVRALNDAPVNTVPDAQSVAADTMLRFRAADGNALSVSDVDAGTAMLTVTLAVLGGVLTGSGKAAGAQYAQTIGAGTATLTLSGTLAEVNATLGTVDYLPGGAGSDTLAMDSNDGGASGNGGAQTHRATVAITITPVINQSIGPVVDVDSGVNAVVENALNGNTVRMTARAIDPDAADAVSYTLTDSAGGRFVIDAVAGVVTVNNGAALDFETAPSHDITVRADSSDGSHSSQTFTIALIDVPEPGNNRSPVFIGGSDSAAVVEDDIAPTLIADGTLVFDDPDATDSHTLSVVAEAANPLQGNMLASITAAALGPEAGQVHWTYTLPNVAAQRLAEHEIVTERFTVTLDDSRGGRSAAQVHVTVIGVNDVPVGNPDRAITRIATPVTIAVLANDTDVDNASVLSVAALQGVVDGVVEVNAAGDLVYTPIAGFAGLTSFSYSVRDQYFARSPLTTVTVAVVTAVGTDGDDNLTGTVATDVILGLGGNDTINAGTGRIDDYVDGGPGNDNITTGAGNDTLIGGDGADALIGGPDDDTFRVGGTDLTGDAISGDSGTDTLQFTSVVTLTGAFWITGVEWLDMGGFEFNVNTNAPVDLSTLFVFGTGAPIVGNAQANTITGTRGDDTIDGGDGNDALSGASGADTLLGGNGADTLAGGAGDDVIIGGTGPDSMTGEAGNDVFRVAGADLTGDSIIGSGGTDTLVFTGTVDLAGGFTLGSIEQLDMRGFWLNVNTTHPVNLSVLTKIGIGAPIVGDANANQITGTASNDTIVGGGGSDWLAGANGDDALFGGLGNDRLTADAGHDVFVFDTPLDATNVDTIIGFNANNSNASSDRIALAPAIFAALGSALDADEFVANAGGIAVDANDFIAYDTVNFTLFYDADGNGPGPKVPFAQLVGVLDFTDFTTVLPPGP